MPTWMTILAIDLLPFPVTLDLVLIAGRALMLTGALCVFAWGFSRWRRAQQQDAARVFEQLDLIQGELHGLTEAVASLSGRLDGLHEQVAMQAQQASGPGASGQRAYENAIRLAQRGATSNDIAAQCGLARHEADMLVRLHGRKEEERSSSEQNNVPVPAAEVATLRKRLVAVS